MSYSKDVLDGMRAVTQAAAGLKDDSVEELVGNLVLQFQSAKLQQDAALFNAKVNIATGLVEKGMQGYEDAMSNISSSNLSSGRLKKYAEEGTPGFGYKIARRKVNNDVESYLDNFEANYTQSEQFYKKLSTVSALTGGESNPIVAGALDGLKTQRENLIKAKELYTSQIFEARGEGVLTSKGRSMGITARLNANISLLDSIIDPIED